MNDLTRQHYAERMVALGLGDNWRLVSADWAGWNIEDDRGIRVEVKQSAALQPWMDWPSLKVRSTLGSFDIAPRTGYLADGGSQWLSVSRRLADIYVFAWHPVADPAEVNHRDFAQWKFFVVLEGELPRRQETIVRSKVEQSWASITYPELGHAMKNAVPGLENFKTDIEK